MGGGQVGAVWPSQGEVGELKAAAQVSPFVRDRSQPPVNVSNPASPGAHHSHHRNGELIKPFLPAASSKQGLACVVLVLNF